MEKKKSNKLITITVLSLLIIIIIFTIYKINKNHEEKLYNVLYSKIKYASKKCYLEEKCKNEITLKELYDNKYLEIQYDPISKEELDSNTIIKIKNDKITIVKK